MSTKNLFSKDQTKKSEIKTKSVLELKIYISDIGAMIFTIIEVLFQYNLSKSHLFILNLLNPQNTISYLKHLKLNQKSIQTHHKSLNENNPY